MSQFNILISICLTSILKILEWWSQKKGIRMEGIQVKEVLNIQNFNFRMKKKVQMNMILF